MQPQSAGQAHSVVQENKWRTPLGHSTCVFSKPVFRQIKSSLSSACIFGLMKKQALEVHLVQKSILSLKGSAKMNPTLNEKRKCLCVFLFRSFNIPCISEIFLETFWTSETKTLTCSVLSVTLDVCSHLLGLNSENQNPYIGMRCTSLKHFSQAKIKYGFMLRLIE